MKEKKETRDLKINKEKKRERKKSEVPRRQRNVLESENGERKKEKNCFIDTTCLDHTCIVLSYIFLPSYTLPWDSIGFPYKVLYDPKTYTSFEILIEWETFYFNNVWLIFKFWAFLHEVMSSWYTSISVFFAIWIALLYGITFTPF